MHHISHPYIVTLYTDVIVELFGSTYTGFALKDSDINMNLRFSNNNSVSAFTMYSYIIDSTECV